MRPWYRYYAGYSPEFVADVIKHFRQDQGLRIDDLIADPWNGAGTTTKLAEEQGVRSWGGDVNPAMVVVAKARLLGSNVRPSELSICEAVLTSAKESASEARLDSDPLTDWFGLESAGAIRSIEIAIGALLDPNARDAAYLTAATRVSNFSSLTAFFYLALFQATRDLMDPFRSSNPTWIKRPKDGREKLRPADHTVHQLFRDRVREMWGASNAVVVPRRPADLTGQPSTSRSHRSGGELVRPDESLAKIEVASSTRLPLADKSAAGVVSSPPYCTRIDYAVATAPELAILGLSLKDVRALRDKSIGTSTITNADLSIDSSWGSTCFKFLTSVRDHSSKASKSYYLRNHLQYFDGIAHSLKEIDRILRPDALAVLVLQDSHYKEVHNDLATIVVEMAESLAWTKVERHDYPLHQVMARMHKSGRTYRKSTNATESVLVFRHG